MNIIKAVAACLPSVFLSLVTFRNSLRETKIECITFFTSRRLPNKKLQRKTYEAWVCSLHRGQRSAER